MRNRIGLNRTVPITFFALLSILFIDIAHAQDANEPPQGTIERWSPELDAVIKPGAKIETIADGFTWVEGPLWIESEKMLLMSDIFSNSIYKWTVTGGKELYLKPSGYTQSKPRGAELGSNGLTLNAKGQLLLCQHGDRRVALMNAPVKSPKANFITLADNDKGKKFNSPNDIVVKSNGDIYFTDPPYGLEKGPADSAKQLPYQGVYRIAKNGTVTLLTDTLTRPNGIAFFPGEKSLLIANSDPEKPHWYIYEVDKQGLLSNGRIFFNGMAAFQKENRSPDGIKIDNKGNLFAAGPGGIWIFNKKGEAIGRIKVNITTSNCAFTNDYKTLFITANHHLLKVELR
jgi:gluconolactonase